MAGVDAEPDGATDDLQQSQVLKVRAVQMAATYDQERDADDPDPPYVARNTRAGLPQPSAVHDY